MSANLQPLDSRIVKRLKAHEGLKLKPYLDTVGKWTIGVGHDLSDDGLLPHEIEAILGAECCGLSKEEIIEHLKVRGITEEQAMDILAQDVLEVQNELHAHFAWFSELDEVRQIAVIDMDFNLGMPHLKGFHDFLGHMAAGRYADAKAEMLDSKWARQVGHRATELADMIETGISPA